MRFHYWVLGVLTLVWGCSGPATISDGGTKDSGSPAGQSDAGQDAGGGLDSGSVDSGGSSDSGTDAGNVVTVSTGTCARQVVNGGSVFLNPGHARYTPTWLNRGTAS